MLLRHVAALLIATSLPLCAEQTEGPASLMQSQTQFAFSLYPTLESPTSNLVFSPYSIATCLSMLYAGSRGETESQLQKTLHLDIDRKNIAKASLQLNDSLLPVTGDEKSYRLNLANALWVEKGTFLLADFRYAIEKQFRARLSTLDFTAAQEATTAINSWVSSQTEGKIPTLLQSGDLNKETRLVLTNAIYFQGNWSTPFDSHTTQDWPFHPTPETGLSVKMMDKTFTIPYYENDLLQAVALPFVGTTAAKSTLAALFLLPKSADNFSAMCSELSNEFDSWLTSLDSRLVSLKLPKFTLNTRSDLNEPLKTLGLDDAFSADANFSGIDGLRNLRVDKVLHQAFFDLNENGVTAAAATAATMNRTSLPPDHSSAVSMILDHPFLFFIVDLSSQEILFMGKVANPK